MTEDTQCETMGIQATSPPTSPLHKMSPYLKRKHDSGCLDFIEANEIVEPKKICIELVCSAATTATATATPSPSENGHKEENKENEASLKETSTAPSSTTTLTSNTAAATTTTTTGSTTINGGQLSPSKPADPLLTPKPSERAVCENENENPKVIVEHQPLPSIYDLRQMTCEDVYDDSGLSDDDSSEEEESSECDDDEDDDVRPSPIFEPVLRGTGTAKPVVTPSPPTPKSIYNNGDRFWSQNTFSMNANTPPPPGSPLPPSATPVAMNGNATFHFLENNNQRIECAENGKSYLQLGTMSHHHHHHHHHHLPVTPVIQPKPNMVYRRPIPPFRNPMLPVQPARPVCDHSNCLMRKSSLCYKSLRSRMLNLSLHKLHMARQNHEGSLRRSVLICNMLRYIEDETEKETVQDSHQFVQAAAAAAVAAPQPPPPQPINHIDTDQYWPPPASNVGIGISGSEEDVQQQQQHYPGSQNGLVSPYGVVGTCGSSNCGANGSHCGMMSGQQSSGSNGLNDTYETTLKDFNSAFRSTPYSSPAHPGMEVDSGLGSGDEDRGINWGSVLSLSSQSELDPLNNNSFTTDTWQTSTSVGGGGGSVNGTGSDTLDISGHSGFDDISWKLSTDEVLKTFPTEDGLFSVGPV